MAYLYGNTWYTDVAPPGLPRVRRSTGVTDEPLALAYEDTLRKLAARGWHRIYRAVAEGDLHVSVAYAADQQGTLHELEATLSDRPLSDAVSDLLALYPDKNHRAAMAHLQSVAPAKAQASWLLDARNAMRVAGAIRRAGLQPNTEYFYMTLVGKLVRQEFGASARRELFGKLDVRKGGARRRHLSLEEILRLERHAGDWWPHIALTLAAGLRRAELQGLEIRNIDYGAGCVRVLGKGRKWRTVPVPADVLALVRGRVARSGGSELAFPGATDWKLTRAWNRVRQAADLEDVRWHDLRRTFGVNCARAGVPLTDLRKYMGHASIQTTVEHYGDYVPDHASPELGAAMSAMGFGAREAAGVRAVK